MLNIKDKAFRDAITKAVMKEIPIEVGQTAVRFYKKNFERQGFVDNGVKKWRKTVKPKNKRILTGEKQGGKLKRSIRLLSASYASVIVTAGNQKIKYAQIHNEGGKITATVTVKAHTRKRHTRKRQGRRQSVKAHTVKQHSKKMNTTIPKRQYMGKSKVLDRHLDIIINRSVNKAFETLF